MTSRDDSGNEPRQTDVSRRELLQGSGGALVGLGAVPAASADATAGEPSVEYLSCTSVRIRGSAAHSEILTVYYARDGGIATDIKSFEPLSGTTVLDAEDFYPDGRSFYVASVTLFDESFTVLADADNPDGSECHDTLTQPTVTPLTYSFQGCGQVCVNQRVAEAVVSTGDSLACRSISRRSDRNDPSVRDWNNVLCRSAGGGEAIVGLCHDGSFTRNPGRCADNYLTDSFDCSNC